LPGTGLWSVYVELDDTSADEQRCDDLQQRLLALLPASGASVGVEPRRDRHLSIQLAITAGSTRRAADEALTAVARAARDLGLTAHVVAHSVSTWQRFEHELAQPLIPELVAYPEIGAILGVSRQRAREIAETHAEFPPPAVDLPGIKLYVRAAVERFAKGRTRRPGRPARSRNPATDADEAATGLAAGGIRSV
jgi:hypothetical protein